MTSFSSTAASLRQQRQEESALSSGSARDRNRLLSGFYELLSWIGSSGTAVACSAWPSVTPSVRYSPLAGYREEHPLAAEIDEVAGGSFYYREPPAIRGRGYVAASLEAALWAFSRSSTFEEGSLMAVNLGEDADATGAIYGQIAGAYYGVSAIPVDWLASLAKRSLIEFYADELLRCSGTGAAESP
jgi:hypothetical protein